MAKKRQRLSSQARIKVLNAEARRLGEELSTWQDANRSDQRRNDILHQQTDDLREQLRRAVSQVSSSNDLACQAMTAVEQMTRAFGETQTTINTLLLRLVPDPAATAAPKPAGSPAVG